MVVRGSDHVCHVTISIEGYPKKLQLPPFGLTDKSVDIWPEIVHTDVLYALQYDVSYSIVESSTDDNASVPDKFLVVNGIVEKF